MNPRKVRTFSRGSEDSLEMWADFLLGDPLVDIIYGNPLPLEGVPRQDSKARCINDPLYGPNHLCVSHIRPPQKQ